MPTALEVRPIFEDLKPGSNCQTCEAFINQSCPAIALIEKIVRSIDSSTFEQDVLKRFGQSGYVNLDSLKNLVTDFTLFVEQCPTGDRGAKSFLPGYSLVDRQDIGLRTNSLDSITRPAAEKAGVSPSSVIVPELIRRSIADREAMEDDLISLAA